MDNNDVLHLERDGPWWRLVCKVDGELVREANAYLGSLADRNFSPRTVRTYGYRLLAYHRWLERVGPGVGNVLTDDLLAFLGACREEAVAGRPGPNVVDLAGRGMDRLAPASVNLRLAAVAGLYEFLAMRDPAFRSGLT
jgi:site-specific recombinase XerD